MCSACAGVGNKAQAPSAAKYYAGLASDADHPAPGSVSNKDAAGTKAPSSSKSGASSTNTSSSDDSNLADYVPEDFEEECHVVSDPLKPFNRAMFKFNDKFITWVMIPTTNGYKKVVPDPVRNGIKKIFNNLLFPKKFINCLLQGKASQAERQSARVLINTTIGGLGVTDVAQRNPKFDVRNEDFDQTLGKWGIGNGCYIVVPVLGPFTVLSAVGYAGDIYTNPLYYFDGSIETKLGINAFQYFNDESYSLDGYKTLVNMSLVPYIAVRNAYLQYRRSEVLNYPYLLSAIGTTFF